jgi:cysteinyl-tRNA synthetase
MQEINQFIEGLISKDYAYESKGSVYFNIEKYKADGYVRIILNIF